MGLHKTLALLWAGSLGSHEGELLCSRERVEDKASESCSKASPNAVASWACCR